MSQEKLKPEELDQNIENPIEKIEDFPEANLNELGENSQKEESIFEGINERLEKSNPDFQEKFEKSGFLQSLGEKIKNSKLLRAGIVAFSLSNASPALASELGEALNNSDAKISSSVENVNLSEKLKKFRL